MFLVVVYYCWSVDLQFVVFVVSYVVVFFVDDLIVGVVLNVVERYWCFVVDFVCCYVEGGVLVYFGWVVGV